MGQVSRRVPCFFLLTLCFTTVVSAVAAREWPDFRGPACDGNAGMGTGIPVTWSESGHIAWKTALPHSGLSSPVIMDGVIWLTGATEDGRESFVLAIDADTGAILRNTRVFETPSPEPLGNNINGYASPSAVLEAGRVYVHFGSYGTACLDAATGAILWTRRDLPCRHYRGPGSSPFLFEDLLILSFDGVDVQYVAALDKNTGETVWKTDRSTVWHDLDDKGQPKREGDFRKAYCTPIIIEAKGGPQLISLGAATAFAYDPRTGREIWKVHHEGHSAAPRPLFGHGRVYLATGHGKAEVLSIRPDGEGDVTDSRVDWRYAGRAVPREPSMLLLDGLLYMVSNDGFVTCLEAATGTEVWQERIGGSYMASPIHADGRLYFTSMQGKTTVMRAGREPEVLAVNELDDSFLASPAVSGKALFLRGKTHLYRIEEK